MPCRPVRGKLVPQLHREVFALRTQPLVGRHALGLAAAALAGAYWFPFRRWFRQWGATEEEAVRPMAGDVLIADPTLRETTAITVDARAEDIWPWLVQIGYRRGGLYSYDWLDRLFRFLDRPSAKRILPEFQHLALGDKIYFGRQELTVSVLDPQRALALSSKAGGMDWVWQWGLYPTASGRTRLVARSSERVPSTPLWWLALQLTDPAAFLMGRKMLLNLKQRAETLDGAETGPATEGGETSAPTVARASDDHGGERRGPVTQ
jgi:hypothetical protein